MMKTKLVDLIKKHLLEYNLLSSGDSVLVCVSGGADSVCLLDVLYQLKEEFSLSLFVAHLNHQLRGDEAKQDASFVQELCNRYHIPFYCETADVASLSKTKKISIEEAGRIARYDYFLRLKEELSIDKIATAHNKNDNVETVCMRFLRGTGIEGLGGIPIKNNLHIIRPLLHTSRKEIEEYLTCQNLSYRTDSSNETNDYTRNRIRHRFLPDVISGYNKNFIETLHENIQLYSEIGSYISKKTNEAYTASAQEAHFGVVFSVVSLLQYDISIIKGLIKKAILVCTSQDTTNKIIRLIYENLLLGNNASFLVNQNLTIYKKYGKLYFVKENCKKFFYYTCDNFTDVTIFETGDRISFADCAEKISFQNKNCIYVKKSLIAGKTITIRNRKQNDQISLKCGEKKIKNLMIDEKIPVFLRDEIPILLIDNEIVWVCGVRDNPRFRATQTDDYIKITYSKENTNE